MIGRPPAAGKPIGWRAAWESALYAPDGFYRGDAGPAAHFRTASHAAPATLAAAVAELARRHGCTAVLDVAAGRGELAAAVAAVAPDLAVTALDLVARPAGLAGGVTWVQGRAPDVVGPGMFAPRTLVMAWEWLDVVPCEVVEVDDAGAPRIVQVDTASGAEELGGTPVAEDHGWLERWWPLDGAEPGTRAEVGLPRDRAWAGLVRALRNASDGGSLLLAVDYDHVREARPPLGSLTGFRTGRQVPPVPDGSCDVTAHVALDAVGAAGEAAGARTVTLTRQHAALRDLGVDEASAGGRELLDPGGLGGFGWLLQQL